MSAAGLLGYDKQFSQHAASTSLNAFPVNGATTAYLFTIPVGFGSVRVERISFVSPQINSDADGTMLVSVLARDVSEGADDTLVNAQSVEANTAHALTDFTLAAEGTEKEFTLDEGDSVRATFTNNSAAIDTNGPIAVTVFYYSIPKEAAGDDIKHASFYRN